MRSRATEEFWEAYAELPIEVQRAAKRAYEWFRENAAHPSLNFKRVHGKEPIYSVRVTHGYRGVGLSDGDEVTWFWMGSRAGHHGVLGGI